MHLQQQTLCRAIDENKWYLSERAGCDVGHDAAVDDFCGRHLDAFAQLFRVSYCRRECVERESCGLVGRVDSLASIAELSGNQRKEMVASQ